MVLRKTTKFVDYKKWSKIECFPNKLDWHLSITPEFNGFVNFLWMPAVIDSTGKIDWRAKNSKTCCFSYFFLNSKYFFTICFCKEPQPLIRSRVEWCICLPEICFAGTDEILNLVTWLLLIGHPMWTDWTWSLQEYFKSQAIKKLILPTFWKIAQILILMY